MLQYFLKFIITALVIVFASEIAKRNTVLSAIIIALPLVSLLRSGYSFLVAMAISCAASALSMLVVKFIFLKT